MQPTVKTQLCKCGEHSWIGDGVIHKCEGCPECGHNPFGEAEQHDYDVKRSMKYVKDEESGELLMDNGKPMKQTVAIFKCKNCGKVEEYDG